MESSTALACYTCRSSSCFNSSRDRASHSIIFPWIFFRASMRWSRLAAFTMARVHATSKWSFSLDNLLKSSLKKFPSHDTPWRIHSEHFRDWPTKRHSDYVATQMEHGITARTPDDATRRANVFWRVVDEGLLTWYVGIVTRKNDGGHTSTEVQDPSFSLQDED
jgi:hypothetical protein